MENNSENMNVENQSKIRNVNVEHKERLKPLDRMALWITDKVGSMGFFILIFIWTSSWLSWNIFAPAKLQFDPVPAFVMWLFISNMIQIFLMPLIMIAQNLQSKHSEARADADFEINTKAELEIRRVLDHLENQNKMILQLLQKKETAGIDKLQKTVDDFIEAYCNGTLPTGIKMSGLISKARVPSNFMKNIIKDGNLPTENQ